MLICTARKASDGHVSMRRGSNSAPGDTRLGDASTLSRPDGSGIDVTSPASAVSASLARRMSQTEAAAIIASARTMPAARRQRNAIQRVYYATVVPEMHRMMLTTDLWTITVGP
jgi:hypothetical protein